MAQHLLPVRIAKLQATLQESQALLLSRKSDILYFSSFVASVPEERSAFLLVTKQATHLLLQNFLPEPKKFSGLISHGFTSANKLTAYLAKLSEQNKINSLQVDFSDLRVDEFQALQKIENLELSNLNRQPIWQMRTQKDSGELAKIKKARQITKQVLQSTIAELKVGQTELEVARLIENKIRQQAGADLAFPSIIAFDEHSALPHHQPSHKKLHHGSVILLDVGATFEHYCADMTRTIFWHQEGALDTAKIQQKAKQFKQIERLVKAAYKQASNLLQQSKTQLAAADLDLACRNFLTKAGFGSQFIHTTGHGLGLDIHEPPSLFKTNPQILLPGMVITIEPGIYLPGKFGVRWENTVMI